MKDLHYSLPHGKFWLLPRSSAQKHEIEQTQTEHTLIEILPERKTQQSLFIANVYSPPRDQLPDFDHFVREIRKRTIGHQVVIVGDFNASHTAWGYHITWKKGSRTNNWNDPLQKTRIGNSVSRDTNPDLTFTANVTGAEWSVLPETLGSDHHILQLGDGSGAATLPRLQRTLSQLTHLIKRIANRRNGLKEHDTLRIIQALLTSRIT
ncbi:hypothetical protein HPB52_013824 [Rhipicephalus sanguineus]|uniref:Endonuclease/exonuclease/phosphatase domain-containing protein n=1 Tax=Rhipicephalus sanguineus TaxID=34632 RepID=A0A9D4PST5_RHISA|nr:hypothetical protein HPB52_013824 [Rhipicephalus sanguineus]